MHASNPTPWSSLSGRRRAASVAGPALALLLAACGGGADPDASPTNHPHANAAMACLREAYPCSFAEVPLEVVERSLALSEAVVQQIAAGTPAADAAAQLRAQPDIADVIQDGPVIVFRVQGGRPMIVDATGEQETLTDPSAPSTGGTGSAAVPALRQSLAAAPTDQLVAGSGPQRRALVLSPFRYEAGFGHAGEQIAAALSGVRGYAGQVTYLATMQAHQPQVTVDTLTRLTEYDVIHVDTHGGMICKDKPADKDPKEKAKTCADGITDFLVQRFHGTAADLQALSHPGIVHYRGRQHASIAVTADFFHHHYPQGLGDRLFILGSCNTFRPDLAQAIAGDRGVFLSWDGFTDFALVRDTGLALVERLGQGLSVGEAFDRLPAFTPENPLAQGRFRRTQRQLGGDLRIRDLLTVRDRIGGALVDDGVAIDVVHRPEDGLQDQLDLEFIVDGVTPERLAQFAVNLVIDGQVIGHLDLAKVGEPVGAFSYRVAGPVPLPYDAQHGQAVKLDFWIPLPDMGESRYAAAPRIRDAADTGAVPFGQQWVLGSTYSISSLGDVTVKRANILFEAKPGSDPDGAYRIFLAKSGTVEVHKVFTDALGCRFDLHHTVAVQAGANNLHLRFDRQNGQVQVKGFGSLPATHVQATGACPDGATTQTVSVGGLFFETDPTPVTGKAVGGSYNSGATIPVLIDWTLDRVQ